MTERDWMNRRSDQADFLESTRAQWQRHREEMAEDRRVWMKKEQWRSVAFIFLGIPGAFLVSCILILIASKLAGQW